jgi:hypothetical protein
MSPRGSRQHHGSHLSRAQRAAAYGAFAAAWLSGTLWLLFHYFLQRQGEFALEPHPLEHWWLRLHGLCAFVLLWLGGLLWALHVRHGLGWPRRRASGLAIMFAFCVLAASGYLLYYADEGVMRDAIGWLHSGIGLSLLVPVAMHVLPSVRERRLRSSQDGAGTSKAVRRVPLTGLSRKPERVTRTDY